MLNPLGTAVVDRSLLDAVERLRDGELTPPDLEPVELALRAFITAQSLVLNPIVRNDFDHYLRGTYLSDPGSEVSPFGDGILDYEFEHPRVIPGAEILASEEASYLSTVAARMLLDEARQTIPERLSEDAFCIARDFLRGDLELIELSEAEPGMRGTHRNSVLRVLQPLAEEYLAYLVGLHRRGFTVYSYTPAARVCAKHLFSLWPGRIFERLDDEFRRASKELVGPGIGFPLPPLITVVLSRAKKRSRIPDEIRNLREEFQPSRTELWSLLIEMWNAPTMKQQVRILRNLNSAANSLFTAAFPERIDALGLGIGMVAALTGEVADVLGKARERDRPHAAVSAISFTKHLSKQLREFTASSDQILRRHLTPKERHSFGL
jgi:hypothetical protein